LTRRDELAGYDCGQHGKLVDTIKEFHDTAHAASRRAERGIPVQAVKDVVKYHHEKRLQYKGKNGGIVWRFSRTSGGKTLVVIAEVKKTEAWLISCFYK
jgi:hypothetical protein